MGASRRKCVNAANLVERVHDQLEGDAWLVGRVTGQEFAKGDAYLMHATQAFPRKPSITNRDAYGAVLDAHGKIAWGRSAEIPSSSC
jgi:hypothetical protein